MCDVELPNPGMFSYSGKSSCPGFLQEFLHDLILGLSYPGNLPHPGNLPCTTKDSMRKSAYVF